MTALNLLKTIFNLISALPTLVKVFRELQAEVTKLKLERRKKELLKEMETNAENLKAAQTKEDERAQRDALSNVIDNYNR